MADHNDRPSHHLPDGRFRNPWPEAAGDDEIRRRFHRVVWERLRTRLPPNPGPGTLPIVPSDLAHPTVGEGELRITWVGHATYLIQLPGLNLLTDPMWSPRPSPMPSMGPRRLVPPSPELDALPEIHAVLLSHDHYDHLDRPTVEALRERFGPHATWYTPLGYRDWFAGLGVENVAELDWWEERALPGGRFRVVSAPARHWSRRTPWSTNQRLWCSWAMLPSEVSAAGDGESAGGARVYFGGDSAYASVFTEIGARLGPFDASLIPIGAYDPRWFMGASHMNPEEAVQVYRDLGGQGVFLPGHWGTFRLTFEDPLEPPRRLEAEWSRLGLGEDKLHVPRHGETVVIEGSAAS